MPTIGPGITIGPGVTATVGPSLPTANLVLQLDAANSSSYSGSGTTWYDISGNNNNATLVNAPTFTSSGDLSTFTFNGSTQYAEIPDSASIRPTSGVITVCCWFNAASAGSINGSILYNKENEYEASAGGGSVTYAYRPNWAWVGGVAFNTGTWYFHAVSYNQVQQVQYANSSAVYTASQTGAIGDVYSNALRIGARGAPGGASSFFNGSIPVLLVYNAGLTASTISNIFQYYKSRYGAV